MSVGKEMVSGVFWSAVEKYSGVVISLIISAILARLITPEEFGTVAIVTVIINFLGIFATMGIFPAIIQRNDLTRNNLNSIFTYSMVIGVGLSVLLFAFSWKIADFYNNPSLKLICQILSVNLFFAAVNVVPGALMAKNKRFKQIAVRTLSLQVIGGTGAVITAFCGVGVYSLLIAPLVTAMGMFFFNIHYYPCRIDGKFDIAPVKKIFGYSSYQFLFEFVNYFSRNADKLIISKYMNLGALGYYDKAYRLMMMPMQNITAVINPVLQPVLSCLQDERAAMAQRYNRLIRIIAMIGFPVAVTFYFTGYELVNIIFGNQWNAAIPAFKAMALSIPLQLILSTSGAIFQSANDTKRLFYTGIRNTLTTVAGFLIAAVFFKTIESMAWAWTITLTINFFATFFVMYQKTLGCSLKAMLKGLVLPLFNALILFAFLSSVQYFIHWGSILAMLVLKVAVSALVTVLFVQLSGQYDILRKLKQYGIIWQNQKVS